jgi:ribosomal RNA-processing protein 36
MRFVLCLRRPYSHNHLTSFPQAQDATSETEGEDEEEGTALKDISFGALAKAQETFKPAKSRKRKLSDTLEEEEQEIEGPRNGKQSQEDFFDTRQRSKEARVDVKKRTSKHAPAVESARKPVSRKRFIFEPSQGDKFRDPRFDAAVMSGNPDRSASQKANKNYSFLSEYQAAEILELKSQIKKAKDPSVISNLKRQVMSLESKIRNAEAQQRESEIRKKHKEKEREALRAGEKSKPYYLKDADVKKLVKEDRLQGMGKRARDKAEKRRMKREKGKEARDMPRVRRER